MTQIHTCYEVSKRLKEFLGWLFFSNLKWYRRCKGGVWRFVFVDPPIGDTMWLQGDDTNILEHELMREDYKEAK